MTCKVIPATPQEKDKTYIMLHKQNFLSKLWTWQKGILKLKSTIEKHAKITATELNSLTMDYLPVLSQNFKMF